MTGTEGAGRYQSLDTIRGFAVMGILLMNVVAFAMPEMAYVNPAAYGSHSGADYGVWTVMFVLVDSKMRGLFSMLFGASMLLVYDRAEAGAGNGRATHVRRMLWLLVFGLLHFYLIWFGDILTLYALCGLTGLWLLKRSEAGLRKAALWLFGVALVLMTLFAAALLLQSWFAGQPGAPAELVAGNREMLKQIGQTDPAAYAKELAVHRGGWLTIVNDQLTKDLWDPLTLYFQSALETLGLIALGMLMFRNGFLTGDWDTARYKRLMVRAYLFGIPPLVALAAWAWASDFDPVVVLGIFLAWSLPFRIIVTLGHAAAIMLIIRRFGDAAIFKRIEAAGRAAFSNYLGTSILMTFIFYGWGLGQYGYWSRWQVYLVVPVAWTIMLLWSKPWLDRYRYGPLEWLWRSLARGELQAMRR